MTIDVVLDLGLALLTLVVGGWIIRARDAFAATIGFVAYGLLLTLAWARLDAIDVALMEAAVGSGLTGALVLWAASGMSEGGGAEATESPSGIVKAVAALLSMTLATMLAAAVLWLPQPGPTLGPAASANAAATGMGNAVTNVLIAFRAMDTMLEKVVLLVALVGVWSLGPDRLWGGRPGLRHRGDTLSPLTFLAQILAPLGIVVGIYLLWVGADAPGGAFQGGAIVAAMWLLLIIAGLADAPPLKSRLVRLALVLGPLLFLIVGLGGLWFGTAFLAYPVAYAKPMIIAIEFAMTLTVAATLGLLIAGPAEREGA